MPSPEFQKKTLSTPHVFIVILPFLLFYWMVPFIADKSIGMDYQTVSIENQMELLFSIKTGSFPLYVPGFALGHSAIALTLGQVFHPLPHIASLLPGYWEGKALQWNTFLRLLSLGLTHLVLFSFLRRLKINTIFSFLVSCITVYNLRMLDLFRYGASLEAFTAHILLCTAIGFYFLNSTNPAEPLRFNRLQGWLGPISITGSTYLLVCSGHPQMMYYGLLGAGLFILIIPFFISTMLPQIHVDFRVAFRFWLQVFIYLILGILLSLAYILPFSFEFIATNVERVKQGYGWADSVRDTFLGTLNNFFLPLRSDVHGAFGGSSIIIMAATVPVLRFFRKIPLVVWITWGVTLFLFLYMQGERTPVHRLVWEYIPFASSFRYAGRIALIMPIFLMMILAWVMKATPFSVRLKNRSVSFTPAAVLSVSSFILMATYLLVLAAFYVPAKIAFSPFAPVSIRNVPHFAEALLVFLGLSSLFLISFQNRCPEAAKTLGIILCLTTLLQVGGSLTYGTWIAERDDKPSFEQMLADKKEKLSYRFYPGTGMYSSIVTAQLENSFIEPFLGKIYYDAESVSSLDNAYVRMLQGRTPQQVFIEGLERNNSIPRSLHDMDKAKGNVQLIYSSFNMLTFRVFSPAPAFFGLSYPYTGHWNASINGQEVKVYRANGSAHAIELPEGESLIEFRYSSPYFLWGVLISCLTLTLTCLFICINALGGIQRWSGVIFVLVFGTVIFWIWQNSLYTGNNLETEYTWIYKPASPAPNLAYGKKTVMSSHLRGSSGYFHSSRAVDGDRGQKTGFATASRNTPLWSVDLNRPEEIKRIIIYEGYNDPAVNKRPLDIAFSDNGNQWHTVYSMTSPPDPGFPLSISLERSESARYIRIQASGHTMLRLDEVEVYGSEK